MPATTHVISLGLSRRLADLLVEEKLIKADQLKEALDAQKKGGEKLGSLWRDMSMPSGTGRQEERCGKSTLRVVPRLLGIVSP